MSASDKNNGFINNKYYNAAALILVICAVFLVCVLMFCPNLLGISSAGKSAEYEAEIFDQSMITSIRIEISDEDWKDILENPTAEEYHRCNVTINGKTFYSAGIRTKGMTSLSQVASSDSDRYSFKLKADKYVDGQTFFGLEEFVINNMYQDPTYMKEYLSYDMLSFIGVPTPLFNFADITLNGEPWGLYLAIEAVEEDFAARVYGSDFGQLYKPESMGRGGEGGGNRPEGSGKPDDDFGGNRGGGNFGESLGDNFGGDFDGQFGNGMFDRIQSGDQMRTERTAQENTAVPTDGAPTNTETERPDFENMSGGKFDGMDGNFGDNFNGNFGGMGDGFGGGSGGGADLVYTSDNVSDYNQIFDNAVFSNAKNSDFKRVIQALKYLNLGEELETYVNVDGTLRYFAANTMLVNLDSYVSGLKHNYYLYEHNGQITMLPWDYNLAFGAFQGGDASSSINFPIDTPVSGVGLEDRPMIGVFLENEMYKEIYHTFLQEIVDDYFNSGYYDAKITELDALIGESVKNDKTAFYDYDEYQKAVSALRMFGELRAKSVQGQLNDTIPSTSEGQSADSSALVDSSALNMNDLGGMNMGGGGMGGGMRGEFTRENNTQTQSAQQTQSARQTQSAQQT